MAFPPCPNNLKAIAHYLKVAEEHDERNVIVSYWCRVHALDIALKLARTAEVNQYLMILMTWLEQVKKDNADNDAITSNVCGQATIENYALKLFAYADNQDLKELYGKNTIKSFYTAGILMDVLTCFGELSEDIMEKRKYAKWKAAYIHNCLKKGECPIPGPMAISGLRPNDFPGSVNTMFTPPVSQKRDDILLEPTDWSKFQGPITTVEDPNSPLYPLPDSNFISYPPEQQPDSTSDFLPSPVVPTPNLPAPVSPGSFSSGPFSPGPFSAGPFSAGPISSDTISSATGSQPFTADQEQISKAQKFCKFANSALTYDDVNTAIENLEKALNLLKLGKDSPE